MIGVYFEVTVKQVRTENYYDSDKGQKVEFERNDEIVGRFYDWERVEAFTNNILAGFENATVGIKVVREAE